MKVEILPEAEDELTAARNHYDAEDPSLGDAFIAEMESVIGRLASAPLRFPLLPRTRARRALGNRFPYLIVFYVFTDRVRIIAVAHQKQRPRYWLDRG